MKPKDLKAMSSGQLKDLAYLCLCELTERAEKHEPIQVRYERDRNHHFDVPKE